MAERAKGEATLDNQNERKAGEPIVPWDHVWRAGANEATTFEVDKDVMVAGKSLPAGKYAFFVMVSDDGVHLIFNKKWDTWGAFDYKKNKAQDALQVTVLAGSNEASIEKLIYTIDKNSGIVSLAWGLWKIEFAVQ